MRRNILISLLLCLILIPGSLRAEGSEEMEPSLEDIFSIFLGTIIRGGAPPVGGERRYTEEELNGRYVVSRFQIVLDRRPTEIELARYRDRLTRRLLSDEEFITTLLNSDEYYFRRENDGAYVRTLFMAALDREPRPGEYDLYTDLLSRGAMSRLQLREELFLNAEFQVMRASRKALAEYGTLSAALREYSLRLHRRAKGAADQLLRRSGGRNYHLQDMMERFQALARRAAQLRGMVEGRSTDESLSREMEEDMTYLLYSIQQGMGYNRELDFLTRSWRDTERDALMLLRFLDYRTEGAGEARTGTTIGPIHPRRIELRVTEYRGERIGGALDPRSDEAREVAQLVLDNFDEYVRGKGLSLLEEFELERSLRKVAAGQGVPQNVIIADRGKGSYLIYYFVNL